MGLISKVVEVTITANNAKYYENLGYIIPKKEITKRIQQPKKQYSYIIGSKIIVNVDDLPKESHIKVDVQCDVCQSIFKRAYRDYNRSIQNQGFYVCNNPSCKKIKTQKTCLEKYGVCNPLGSDDVRLKIKSTIIDKYGVSNVMQNELIKKHTQTTNMKKYGGISPSSSERIKEKIRITVNKRYGCDNVFQNEEIKERIKQQNLLLYGVENSNQREDVKILRQETAYLNRTGKTSMQQEYICCLYHGELNYPIKYYMGDIVLYDEKIDIEYDGSGHRLCVTNGFETEEEFNQKEIIRSCVIKNEGYKQIRIISRKDNLPSDSVLLSMLDYARTFFKENPERSWISFDIDNSCIYNAYHKESDGGIPYDFGTLRKIKKSDLPTEDHNDETRAA